MGKGGRDEREVSGLVCHLNYVSTCLNLHLYLVLCQTRVGHMLHSLHDYLLIVKH